MKNEDLYAGLECVSDKIRKRRLRLAGHCVRHPELGANLLVRCEPTQGTTARGRPILAYIGTLKRDAGCKITGEIRSAMLDRSVWKRFIKECPRFNPGRLERWWWYARQLLSGYGTVSRQFTKSATFSSLAFRMDECMNLISSTYCNSVTMIISVTNMAFINCAIYYKWWGGARELQS